MTWETSIHVLSSSRVFGRENRTWYTRFRHGMFHQIRIWLLHFRQEADQVEIRYSVTRWLIGRNCWLRWIHGFPPHLVLAIRQEISSGHQKLRNPHFGVRIWKEPWLFWEVSRLDCLDLLLAGISEQVGDISLTNLMWSIGADFLKDFCIGCINLCISHRFPADLMQWRYSGEPVAILVLTNTGTNQPSPLMSYYLCITEQLHWKGHQNQQAYS